MLPNVINKGLFLLVGVVVTIFIMGAIKKDPDVVYREKPIFIESKATVVKAYTDKESQPHTVIKANYNQYSEKELKTGKFSAAMDSVLKTVDIQRSRIQELESIVISSKQENLKAKKEVNALKQVIYRYKNQNIEMTFRHDTTATDTGGVFSYHYNYTLNRVVYWKREVPVIGKKVSYIDIWTTDTNATFNGIDRISVRLPEKKFGVSLKTTALAVNNFKDVKAGPGVEFKMGKVHVGGFYLYGSRDQKWKPAVRFDVDLYKF